MQWYWRMGQESTCWPSLWLMTTEFSGQVHFTRTARYQVQPYPARPTPTSGEQCTGSQEDTPSLSTIKKNFPGRADRQSRNWLVLHWLVGTWLTRHQKMTTWRLPRSKLLLNLSFCIAFMLFFTLSLDISRLVNDIYGNNLAAFYQFSHLRYRFCTSQLNLSFRITFLLIFTLSLIDISHLDKEVCGANLSAFCNFSRLCCQIHTSQMTPKWQIWRILGSYPAAHYFPW